METTYVPGRNMPPEHAAASNGRSSSAAPRHGQHGQDSLQRTGSAMGSAPPLRPVSWWGSADISRWGIRPKLITIVLIPTVAALLLGGLRMESALTTGAAYQRLTSLASVLPQADTAVDALQTERDLTAGVLAAQDAAAAATPPKTPQLQALPSLSGQRTRADTDIADLRNALVGVDSSHDAALQQKIASAVSQLDGLAPLRHAADIRTDSPTLVSASYGRIIASVLALTGELSGQSSGNDADVTRRVSTVQSLAAAKEALSQQRGVLYAALLSGTLAIPDYTSLVAADNAQQTAVEDFYAGAPPATQASYSSIVSGTPVTDVFEVVSGVLATESVKGVELTAAQWLSDTSAEASMIGQVEATQVLGLSDRIRALGQSARDNALGSGALIYAILGLALLATLLVARSILRPLRMLRSAALDVAYRRLPETVRQLQEDDSTDVAMNIVPIGVASTDEIGQVARAFDAVHTEAVQLAGQQALMRGNVSKMFTNLSRRSQSLVERQLRLIDELEAGEQDADQLANLFRLDHLATRMRRNDENLLVLAGSEGGRRRTEPVPMLDVLRAATGEVEQYARVKLETQSGFELLGPAVNDVVHLLAELVENATTFSSPSTLVWLRSHSLGSGGELMIEVEDHGIGMNAQELDAANEKLANPSGMDISMSRLMGLFVVARLAQRHDILVQLRPSPYGGIIAFVRLPASLVSSPSAAIAPSNNNGTTPTETVAERSPIFEELQSEWFVSPVAADAAPIDNGVKQVSRPVANWRSPGDDGWRAAAALATRPMQPETLTSAGLPQRIPGRNLIPGAADDAPTPTRPVETAPERAARHSRELSSYQAGIQRARGGRHQEGPNGSD